MGPKKVFFYETQQLEEGRGQQCIAMFIKWPSYSVPNSLQDTLAHVQQFYSRFQGPTYSFFGLKLLKLYLVWVVCPVHTSHVGRLHGPRVLSWASITWPHMHVAHSPLPTMKGHMIVALWGPPKSFSYHLDLGPAVSWGVKLGWTSPPRWWTAGACKSLLILVFSSQLFSSSSIMYHSCLTSMLLSWSILF